jgi:uncharacterized protein
LPTAEQLNNILADFYHTSPAIEACGLVSRDGLVIAMNMPSNFAGEKYAAIATTIVGDCERICRDLNRSGLEQVLLKGEDGYIILQNVGKDTVLLVMVKKDPNLGMILLRMKSISEQITELFEGRNRNQV